MLLGNDPVKGKNTSQGQKRQLMVQYPCGGKMR